MLMKKHHMEPLTSLEKGEMPSVWVRLIQIHTMVQINMMIWEQAYWAMVNFSLSFTCNHQMVADRRIEIRTLVVSGQAEQLLATSSYTTLRPDSVKPTT